MMGTWTRTPGWQGATFGGGPDSGKSRRGRDLIRQRGRVAHGLTFRLEDGDGLDQVNPTGQSVPASHGIIETLLDGVKQNLPHVLTAAAVASRPREAQEEPGDPRDDGRRETAPGGTRRVPPRRGGQK